MSRLFTPLSGRAAARRSQAHSSAERPRVEILEDRTLLSAAATLSGHANHLLLAPMHRAAAAHMTHAIPVVRHAIPVVHHGIPVVRHAIPLAHHVAAPRLGHLAIPLSHSFTDPIQTPVTMTAATTVAATPTPTPAPTPAPTPTPTASLAATTTTSTDPTILNLTVPPIDLNLLGLEVRLDDGNNGPVTVAVSAQSGNGELLGNLLSDVGNLLNLQGVNNALNSVLGSAITLLNSTSLSVSGVNTGAPIGSTTTQATTPVLDLYVAPIHVNLLGALVQTSPIHLTLTAHSGPGLVLGDLLTDLANLLNTPPKNGKLTLDYINNQLGTLLNELATQLPGFVPPATTAAATTTAAGSEQVLGLVLPPLDVNLLGLVLQTSQIQVNANAQSGGGDLLGNLLTDLLNTLGATPQQLGTLNGELNRLLATVVNVLNASALQPLASLSSLSPLLQQLATTNLTGSSTSPASAPILNLDIATNNGTPPVNVNLLGLDVTTSNIQLQLLAQPGANQVLGNLVYNVANLLNPGGSLNVLAILDALGV